LDKPLAVVITKLDLASKANLRKTLSKILSVVKETGRTPTLLTPDQIKVVTEFELTSIPKKENDKIQEIIKKQNTEGFISVVPIILTSAAKGIGIRSMHALLKNLPIPSPPTSHDLIGPTLNPEQPSCLFHIEDIYDLPASYEPLASNTGKLIDQGIVVAGYLRFGSLSVGMYTFRASF